MSPRLFLPASCLFLALSASAQVTLPALFSDGLVLQRDQPAQVWGQASPSEKVTVSFGSQTKAATAGAEGRWSVVLDPLPASEQPATLTVAGTNRIEVRDVLVGDVWLASGQSNMAATLSNETHAAETLPAANDPGLRFFVVRQAASAEPRPDVSAQWTASTSKTAAGFSAVAYYFAREIRRDQKVPVAILQAAWGGTPVETWISLDGVRAEPPLAPASADWDKALARHRSLLATPQVIAAYEADLALWKKEVYPVHAVALKAHSAAVAAGLNPGPKPQPSRPEPDNPDPTGVPSPSKRPQTPSVSFNGMVAPLAPFALRGFLWYQGEQNASKGLLYRQTFPRLIEDWRRVWKTPSLPFVFVQLPAFGPDPAPDATAGWPRLREAQAMALRLPATGMAVTLDVGDPADVHPKEKLTVGRRLALEALRLSYGRPTPASPLFDGFSVEGGSATVRFRNASSGLAPGQAPWTAPRVQPFPTDRLAGFFIAGEDRQWFEAEAKIAASTVTVSSPKVPKPVAVRYGWANSPRANLYSRDGLPAAPFRTDDWP